MTPAFQALQEDLEAWAAVNRGKGNDSLADECQRCGEELKEAYDAHHKAKRTLNELLDRAANLARTLGKKPYAQIQDALAVAREDYTTTLGRMSSLLGKAEELLRGKS
jgi:hypothetical protein